MGKLIASLISGLLGGLLLITGLGFFFALAGLILAIMSYREKAKNIVIPVGLKSGKKSSQPFVSTRLLSMLLIGFNGFILVSSSFTLIGAILIGMIAVSGK